MKNRWWVVLVLAGFIALLLPREWWHDCAGLHAKRPVEKHSAEHHFSQGKCPVCDFHLYTADLPQFYEFRFERSFHSPVNLFAESQITAEIPVRQLRGPPSENV